MIVIKLKANKGYVNLAENLDYYQMISHESHFYAREKRKEDVDENKK